MTLRDLAAHLGDDAGEPGLAREVEAELAAHLDLSVEALESHGASPEEARRIARERFGDLARVRRECLRIRTRGIRTMKTLLVVSNLVLVTALAASLLIARTQHVRAQRALEEARMAMDQALQARLAAEREPPALQPVVVEIGDVIETLDQHRNLDFGEQARVQLDGKVLLQELGWVSVAGLTREEVEELLTKEYAPYYQDLMINVIVHDE